MTSRVPQTTGRRARPSASPSTISSARGAAAVRPRGTQLPSAENASSVPGFRCERFCGTHPRGTVPSGIRHLGAPHPTHSSMGTCAQHGLKRMERPRLSWNGATTAISSNPADCRCPLSPLCLRAPASAYHQAQFQPLVTPAVHALPTQGHADLSAPVGLRRSSPSSLPRTRLDWCRSSVHPGPRCPLGLSLISGCPPEAPPISHPLLRVWRVLHASFTGHCPQLYSLVYRAV